VRELVCVVGVERAENCALGCGGRFGVVDGFDESGEPENIREEDEFLIVSVGIVAREDRGGLLVECRSTAVPRQSGTGSRPSTLRSLTGSREQSHGRE